MKSILDLGFSMNWVMKLTLWVFGLLVVPITVFSQTSVNVLNIPIGEGTQPRHFRTQYNYTLLQGFMVNNSTPKLLNSKNFGPEGIIKKTLSIVNGFENLGSITNANQLEKYDVIFIGGIGGNDSQTFLDSELATLLEWSSKPGNVLIVAEQPAGSPMTNYRNFVLLQTLNTNPSRPWKFKNEGIPNLFSGPFGNLEEISQNGASQGYFDSICDATAIFWGSNNKPTILFDQQYNDVYIADTDFFSSLNSEMAANNIIKSKTEIAWGNLWAWAVSEVSTPKARVQIP